MKFCLDENFLNIEENNLFQEKKLNIFLNIVRLRNKNTFIEMY